MAASLTPVASAGATRVYVPAVVRGTNFEGSTSDATVSPTPTSTPVPVQTAVPTRTPVPDPLFFRFEPGVSAADQDDMRTGAAQGRAFLASIFGEPLPSSVGVNARKGTPNDPAGEGACCTAFPEITIWVDHLHWTRADVMANTGGRPDYFGAFTDLSAEHRKTMAHEYAHHWQFRLGCIYYVGADVPQPRWFLEGSAEWVGYSTIENGGINAEGLARWAAHVLQNDTTPLASYERTFSGYDPYSVGRIAVARLVDRAGAESIRTFCADIGVGQPWRDAFPRAFGLTVPEFYDDFERYRAGFRAAG